MEKTWKQMWKDHLRNRYEEASERWSHPGVFDDRLVFCISYHRMQGALNTLPDEPHLFIRGAVTSKLEETCRMMDEIAERFKDRT